MAVILKDMGYKMNSFSKKSAEWQARESLAQVRILASRTNLIPSHVLLATIEALVTVATKFGHRRRLFLESIHSLRSFWILKTFVILP